MKDNMKQNFANQLVQRAWDDPKFKADLIANPVETMEAETGRKLDIPTDKTLVVVDQGTEQKFDHSKHVYFVVPKKPESVELTEQELEQAVGGEITYIAHYDKDGNKTGSEWVWDFSIF